MLPNVVAAQASKPRLGGTFYDHIEYGQQFWNERHHHRDKTLVDLSVRDRKDGGRECDLTT